METTSRYDIRLSLGTGGFQLHSQEYARMAYNSNVFRVFIFKI